MKKLLSFVLALVLVVGIAVLSTTPLVQATVALTDNTPTVIGYALGDELVSQRTENSKTFNVGNGRRQVVVSIGAIHYKDDYTSKTEGWKDIDLTWVSNKITKAPYELTHIGNKCTLKDKKSGEVSTIELLDVKPVGIKFEILPENSAVRFRHILPTDKIPFEAKFRIAGKIPFLTRAFDDEGELELETGLKDGILTEKLSAVVDKEIKQVRPAKGNICIDPTWQVVASTDDCARRLTSAYWSLTGDYMIVGSTGTSYYQWGCGMRFQSITIPKGSTIDGAYLTLRCLYSRSDTVVNSRISAEDVDDAPTFANDASVFDTRFAAHTTARVDWDAIPAWTAGLDYNSPEIKTVIQEIVNRGDWASGQDMVIFWEDYDDRSNHGSNVARYAISYDYNSTYAPKLVVTYTVPTAPTVTTQAVDTIEETTAMGHGTITNTGGANVTARGICWNTAGSPTTSDNKSQEANGFSTGAFSRSITGLTASTLYRVRAYAINAEGTSYGNEVEFTTDRAPSITTDDAVNVAYTTAQLNSTLDDDGGEACDVRFQYYTSENWTACDNTTWIAGYNTGEHPFANVSGLTNNTLYYFRAQAKNNITTANGTAQSFTTTNAVLAPTNFKSFPEATKVLLSWTKGIGSTDTHIRYSEAGYPADNTSGTLVYSGSLGSYTHSGLTTGHTYYYSAWGRSGATYSDNHTTVMATTLPDTGIGEGLPSPTIHSSWFGTPDYTKFSDMPLYYTINRAADATGMPRNSFWFMGTLFGCLFASIVVFGITRDGKPALIVLAVTIMAGALIGLMPLFMIALAVITFWGALHIEKGYQ